MVSSILLFKSLLLLEFLLFDTQNTPKFSGLESLNNRIRHVRLSNLKSNLPINYFSFEKSYVPVFFPLCSLEHIYSHMPNNFILPITSNYFILHVSPSISSFLFLLQILKTNPTVDIYSQVPTKFKGVQSLKTQLRMFD